MTLIIEESKTRMLDNPGSEVIAITGKAYECNGCRTRLEIALGDDVAYLGFQIRPTSCGTVFHFCAECAPEVEKVLSRWAAE